MRIFTAFTRYLAVIVVIGYGIFTWWMIREASHPEIYWSRLVFLFEGIEAIVFAAAGLIFGTAVHRKQLEEAHNQADQYRADARLGRALDAAIRAYALDEDEAGAPPARSGGIGGLDSGSFGPNANREEASLAYLLRFANELKNQSLRGNRTGR